MKARDKSVDKAIRVFADGSGCRPDGRGSGFAWLREQSGQSRVIRVFREDGLTNNQAEYKAILSAIEALPKGSKAEVLTDSENTCFQLKGTRRVRDPKLFDLYSRIQALMVKNGLRLDFTWIPRRENLAGKLL